MKLLIVDDHALMRRTLREMLATADDEVREAADGAQAEVIFAEQQPDWVIMDLKMEPVGGISATQHIRALQPSARVIILSDYDDPDLRARAQAAGALAYLTKDRLSDLYDFIHAAPG